MGKSLKIRITILPRLAISSHGMEKYPEKVIAYQLMGNQNNGDYCPFLDVKTNLRSPHGGFLCKIYNTRPLACRAYPVIKESKKTLQLDSHCAFSCKYGSQCSPNLMNNELLALEEIRNCVSSSEETSIWRYATHIGDTKFREQFLPEGWYLQEWI